MTEKLTPNERAEQAMLYCTEHVRLSYECLTDRPADEDERVYQALGALRAVVDARRQRAERGDRTARLNAMHTGTYKAGE